MNLGQIVRSDGRPDPETPTPPVGKSGARVSVRQYDAKRSRDVVIYEGPCDAKHITTIAGLQGVML
jgi:hypothetical protein